MSAPPQAVRVQAGAFDPGAELSAFGCPAGAGAVASFVGHVRGDGPLEIEHFPGMAEEALGAAVRDATRRWGLLGCAVVHRHGPLAPGEPIVMVIAAAPHRRAAFEAAEWLMDCLKSRAPFWKREGGAWVEAREEDERALARWD